MISRFGWLILFSLPFSGIAIGALLYNVAIPFSDDLYMAPRLARILLQHDWSFESFWFQHNEHYVVFPFLITLLLTAFFGWNSHILLALNPIFIIFTTFLFYKISEKSIPNMGSQDRIFLAWITSLLLTSLQFWEVWSHAFTINLILANVAFLAAVWSLYCLRWRTRTIALGIFFCIVSSFSALHGTLAWISVFPIVIIRSNKKVYIAMLWLLTTSLVASLYLWHYTPSELTPDLLYGLYHPREFLYFLFLSIGTPLFSYFRITAGLLGASILACLFALLFVRLIDKKSFLLTLPWASITLFSFGATLLLTIGRVGGGVPWRAMQSRFGLLTYFLPISFLYLSALSLGSTSLRNARFFSIVVFLILVFVVSSSFESLSSWRRRGLSLREGVSCVRNFEFANEDCLKKLGNGATDGNDVRNFAPLMKQLKAF